MPQQIGGNVKPQQSTIWPSKVKDSKDVEIKVVSADGIALYVPEHLLKSHSEVLSSMINDIPPPTPGGTDPRLIEFSDPDIEGYKTLHLFLAVVTQNSLEGAIARDETDGGRGETLISAMRFAEKWDCGMAAHLITLYLMELARRGRDQDIIDPFDIFVIAAQLDLPHIAAKVIELYTGKEDAADSASQSPTSTWPFLLSGEMVDIDTLEDEAWQVVPGSYLRALYRASTRGGSNAQRAAKFLEAVTRPKKG
ncbi:hypothetical protein B9479_007158 [Cryptococcus floricola]|uniref:BTB domain-containing protein n=1 Tax=Cryptococcus floricola TaxID=2591691 RepID=A0A5D3AN75_9TREE|nr:hypothetical protein B9479_007158 [Cryptococcus floricola]